MTDKTSFYQDRFPCASSATCSLWLEYLDLPDSPCELSLLDLTQEDRRKVASLQQHVLNCISCASLIRYERYRLAQQRALLQQWLGEAEQYVPSSVEQILSAVSRDTPPLASGFAPEIENTGGMLLSWSQQRSERNRTSPERQRHPPLRTIFALVAAVTLVFTGFEVFSQITALQYTPSAAKITQQMFSASPARPLTSAWSSLVLTRASADDKNLLVENYDPLHNRSVRLLPSCCSLNTTVDGVSHAGDNLVYHSFSQDQTSYHLLSGQSFVLRGQGSNAIWSTDDHFIYTSDGQHLQQYAVQEQSQHYLSLSSPVPISHLQFYYQQNLYFSSVHNQSTDLYRVDLATSRVQLLIKNLSPTGDATSFWLSPSGTKIYYVDMVAGANTIFASNLDGSDQKTVAKNAVPVGYAADNTLVALRSLRGTFQLVKLASSPLVLVANLAPGAQKLSAQDVALAPYAGAVVAVAHYNDGSVQLWSTDLTSLQQQVVLRLSSAQQMLPVHLIGWDRLSVA